LEVKFSVHATDTLLSIVSFIESKWSIKVADEFIEKAYKTIDSIAAQPYMYQATSYENVRRAVITKQTSIIYKIHSQYIEILFFWDNRQDSLIR